jgi:hypothetical protein
MEETTSITAGKLPPFLEKFQPHLELISAVLLGLGTIGAAFAAYQAALWSGNTMSAYNQAIIKYGDANREYLNGSMEISFDSMVYLESLREDPRTADDVRRMRSHDLEKAVEWSDKDLEQKEASLTPAQEAEIEKAMDEKWAAYEAAPVDSPERDKLMKEIAELEKKTEYLAFLESPRYQSAKRSKSEALSKEAEKLMAEGSRANITGDTFTLLTVYFAVSLFFAGLAAVMREDRVKTTFIGLSCLIFLFSIVRMLLLPFA